LTVSYDLTGPLMGIEIICYTGKRLVNLCYPVVSIDHTRRDMDR
jgi:hypothetical protein